MFRRISIFGFELCILLLATSGYAGGWSGNGGDLLQDQDNAWFIGDQEIEYCIERDDSFPWDLQRLSGLVTESLHDWKTFFTTYRIDKYYLGQPGTLGGLFPDGKLRGLTLNFKQVEHCNAFKQQIRFLFGTRTPEIEQFRAAKGDALGFALRPAYDHETYRNGGFVWISSIEDERALDWNAHPALLKHLLLHELGHVFGMRHDSVFVMSSTVSSEIMSRFRDPAERLERYYGRIEHPTWPYRFQDGSIVELTHDQGGAMGIPAGYRSNLTLPQELLRSLGLHIDGYHALRLRYLSSRQVIIIEIDDSMAGLLKFEVTARGYLSWKGYDNGPGIYTNWLCEAGKQFFARIGLDLGDEILPFEGVWKVGNKVYPITIGMEPKSLLGVRRSGVAFRVYLGEEQKWWVVR